MRLQMPLVGGRSNGVYLALRLLPEKSATVQRSCFTPLHNPTMLFFVRGVLGQPGIKTD